MVAAAKTKELPRRNWQKIEKKKQKRIKETCAQPNKGKKKPCRPCQRIWWSFHKEWHSNMQKKKKEEAERNNE